MLLVTVVVPEVVLDVDLGWLSVPLAVIEAGIGRIQVLWGTADLKHDLGGTSYHNCITTSVATHDAALHTDCQPAGSTRVSVNATDMKVVHAKLQEHKRGVELRFDDDDVEAVELVVTCKQELSAET